MVTRPHKISRIRQSKLWQKWRRPAVALACLVVIGLAASLYLTNYYVSAADYGQLFDQSNQTVTAYNQLITARDDAVAATAGNRDDFDTAYGTYRSDLTSYAKLLANLSTQPALKNDQLKQSYRTLTSKSRGLTDFMSTEIANMPLVQEAKSNCKPGLLDVLDTTDLGNLQSIYDEAVASCQSTATTMRNSKSKPIAAKGQALTQYLTMLGADAKAAQDAYLGQDRTTFQSSINKVLDQINQYPTTANFDSLTALDNSLLPTAELNNFTSLAQKLAND